MKSCAMTLSWSLIDVPTGILIGIRSKDITPAIGSVNSPTFIGTSFSQPLITMSNTFTSIFNNNACIKGVCSLRVTRGTDHHCSILDNVQSQGACWAENQEMAREVTPFDFNLGWYSVSPLRYLVEIARLILNFRSLGQQRVSSIPTLRLSTWGCQRLGPKRGLRTSIGTTS